MNRGRTISGIVYTWIAPAKDEVAGIACRKLDAALRISGYESRPVIDDVGLAEC